jgi:hypothetical protein
VLSCHTTYTLSPSDEICGLNDTPVLSLMFSGGSLNVRPPSILLAKKTSKLLSGVVLSVHTTYTLSPSHTTCESDELPVFLLMFCGGSLNVRPPSVLLAKKTSLLPGVSSCHTVHTLLTGTGGIGVRSKHS